MPIFEGVAGDSIANAASIAAPTASATIVTSSALQAGLYQIEAQLVLTGTSETQNNNGLFTAGNITMIVPTVTGVPIKFLVPRVRLATNGIVKIVANANATAGSVYSGVIILTRVG